MVVKKKANCPKRGNAADQVAICFSFATDQLRGWRKFFGRQLQSGVNQNHYNLAYTFDTIEN